MTHLLVAFPCSDDANHRRSHRPSRMIASFVGSNTLYIVLEKPKARCTARASKDLVQRNGLHLPLLRDYFSYRLQPVV